MPLIAQICMVIVTIALVVMAAMAFRLMLQTRALLLSANLSLVQLPALIEDAKRTSIRADELLIAFTRITRSTQAGVSQLEGLATRSTMLASALLDEVEVPVSRTVEVIRAIRFGASFLAERWKSRGHEHTHTNQGDDHVGEERWLDDGGLPAGSRGRGRAGTDLRADVR